MRRLFMPGCALSAYNPALTVKTASFLRTRFPDIAVAQKCCGKPTQLTGQRDLFEKRLGLLEADIRACRAEQVISACPGCLKVLSRIEGVQNISLWEVLCETGLPDGARGKARDAGAAFSVHDPCAARESFKTHECVRRIVEELGYALVPSEREGLHTPCCGQGGMVSVTNGALASAAARLCIEGFKAKQIAAYCSTCRGAFASNGGRAWHVLDLIWGDVVREGDEPPSNTLAHPMKAWKNRFIAGHLIRRLGRPA